MRTTNPMPLPLCPICKETSLLIETRPEYLHSFRISCSVCHRQLKYTEVRWTASAPDRLTRMLSAFAINSMIVATSVEKVKISRSAQLRPMKEKSNKLKKKYNCKYGCEFSTNEIKDIKNHETWCRGE